MTTTTTRNTVDSAGRVAFLDNLRTLMVLLVLVFHSAASYSSTVEFWPFHDRNPSKILDLFLFVSDTFMMSVLFFVAGYFALPSVRKKGSWAFVKGKLTRLGVPWLVITVALLPLLDYIHYRRAALSDGGTVRGYGAHWLLSMKRIGDFHVGWMNMAEYRNMADQFYQRYMWYVSLLVLFFVVFALFWAAAKSIVGDIERPVSERPIRKPGWYRIVVTAAIAVLLFALVRFFFYENFADKGWFSLGNVFQFQCGKLVLYACCFSLGAHAFLRNWLKRSDNLGRLWAWALGCLLLFGINLVTLMMLKRPGGNILPFQVLFVLFYPLWTLSFLGLFLSVAARYLNRSTAFSRSLADWSYGMYLGHYAFSMILPLFLGVFCGMAVLFKFSIVATSTLLASYVLSRFVLTPFPRMTIASLVLLNVAVILLR
jgi:glucans biosynthesis protein C